MSQHDEFNARVERSKAEADREIARDGRNRALGRDADGFAMAMLIGFAEGIGSLVPYLAIGGMCIVGVSIWLGISIWAALGLCIFVSAVLAVVAAGHS